MSFGEREGVFNFEKEKAVNTEDLSMEKTEFLIPDFLVKNAITLCYSLPKQGKTWFTYAVAKQIAKLPSIRMIFYCDFDNPKRQLAKRGVGEHLLPLANFKYLHRSKIDCLALEFVERIDNEAVGQDYKDCVFVFDSTRDFVDNVHSHNQAKRFMQIMKNIREAGGTVILIHHTTKGGKAIDGSGEFLNSIDNAYELKQSGATEGKIHYLLEIDSDRDSIKECAFSVDLKTLSLQDLDPIFADMTAEDKEFTEKAQSILKDNPKGINQTSLLTSIGFKNTDKKARAKLDKYTDVFWKAEKRGKPTFYTTI